MYQNPTGGITTHVKCLDGSLKAFPNVYMAFGWWMDNPDKAGRSFSKAFIKEMIYELTILDSLALDKPISSTAIVDCSSQCKEQVLAQNKYE